MLETGTIVAGYRIDGVLGEGGMGVVYRATQLSLNRTVALKLLASELSDDTGFRERFRREGQLQAAIDHPHIVTVYEAGQTEQGLFLAMRLVRGPTLKEEIQSREIEPERGLRVLRQVADALDAAHEVGLIHRDVKPQNILIATGDHAYLADFGLTKAPDDSSLTETGQFIGTIDYVSPEQARGDGATGRSDIYALAGVLYESLALEVPYSRPSEPAVLYAHMMEPPPRLSERRADLPTELDEVIARGMAKDASERPSTAGELIREAEAALGLGPGPMAAPTRPAATVDAPVGAADTAPAAVSAAPGGATRAAGAQAAATSPAAPGRPARERVRVPIAGVAVAVIAVAATAGFLAGGSGSGGSEDFTSSASAGPLALSFPDGWRRSPAGEGVPGMRFSDPIELEASAPAGARAVAGLVRGSGQTLLPPAFRARLGEAPRPNDPVRLGSVDALRHTGLTPEGLEGTATVYAAPTDRGVATVACVAPQGAGDFLADCERVAATLELSGAKPFPLGPSEQYARLLAGTTRGLARSRAAGARRLRAADTPDGQAAAAAALATAYNRASRRLRVADVSPREAEANARISRALGAIGAAYDRAASAARAGDGGAYEGAQRTVRRGGARLERAFKALSALGYSV